MLGGGGVMVAHGSSGLANMAYTPISLPHVLFNYAAGDSEYH